MELRARRIIGVCALTLYLLLISVTEAKADTYGDWEFISYPREVTLTAYYGTDTDVVIPEYIGGKVVNCLRGTFYQNTNIHGVYVPRSVERIEANYTEENGRYVRKETFGGCTNLTSVTGCDCVYTFAEGTFKGCASLNYIKIPKAKKVPGQMFYGCTNLERIHISSKVKEIDYQAFENCISLKKITGCVNVKIYSSGAFRNCTSLKSITLGKTKRIPEFLFYNCESLKEIIIPSGVKSIQKGAFAGSGIESITIPRSVEYLGGDLYDPVYGLKNGAFADCKNLKKVKGCKGVKVCGRSVFSDCKSLKSIALLDIEYIPARMFAGCKSLKSFEFSKNVSEINDYAFFDCTRLTNVVLTKKIKKIRHGAFEGCTSIGKLTIPKVVNTIFKDSIDRSIKLKVYKNSKAASVFPKAKRR